ncbi:uncharacterized protein LOC111001706 [Pieris rapae]|uniref:uncharacterized protein LOC111001706 n=1 Tax=Pieris rapae TaxID=64459 RepID=UPI001E27AD6B|nr:uncharacterized protein LOC111001706 [Pieris rapae]XP_045487331.1 uncharacterized protein LOC111001706 [Pieris rapae]XP_045487332.1 uncharacterized protein LOC111001706 [Pieris rapae]
MESTTSSSSTRLLEEDIPTDFKALWLNTTLKFVKNHKQSLLKYPEMPAHRIKFLKVMITTSNTNGLFSPLWEALKIMGLKYDFRMYVERTGSEQGHLYLEKILKKEDVNENRESKPESCTVSKGQKKRAKKKRNKKEFMQTVREQVDSISPSFVKNTLNKIFEFVEDEAQASLPFDSLSRVEAQFIYNINGILKRKDAMKELFSPVCNILWKKIDDTLKDATHFALEVSSINVDPDTAKRQMTLFKTPKFSNKKTEEINESVDSDIENESHPNMEYGDISALNSLKLLQSIENCIKKDSTHQATHINNVKTLKSNMLLESNNLLNESTNSGELEVNNVKTVINTKDPTIDMKSDAINNKESTNRKPILNSNPVIDKESGIDDIDREISKLEINSVKIPIVEKIVVGRKRNITIQVPTVSRHSALNEMMNSSRLPKPKVKLIEGLTKPLESEKGLRMMRSMGWDGGALGTREGGITEPIMPALHLTAKAGLGHVGTNKVVKFQNSLEYRVHILENILNLLNSSATEFVIDFCDPLKKKEINFLGHVDRALKSRKQIGVNSEIEEEMVKGILAFLSSKLDLMLDIKVVNKRQVKLEKKSILNVQNETKQKQSVFVFEKRLETTLSLPNAGKIKANKTVRGEHETLTDEEILSLLDLKEQVKISKKSMNKLKIRLFIIKSFLDFIKSDSDNVILKCKLSSPMRKYIHGLSSAINSRTEHTFRFSIETFVWLDIVQFLKGRELYLMVQMDSRSFGLNKVSKSNANFTNYENYAESTGSSESSFTTYSKDGEEEKNQQSDVPNIFYFGNNINNVSNDLSEHSKFKIDDSTNNTKSSVINVRIIQVMGKPMTIDTVKDIQTRISNAIVSPPLPMLKCHGAKSDSLIYSCYDKDSYQFLKEVLKDFQIVEYEISSLFKMAAKFKSNAPLSKVLHWLQLYHNLDVSNWNILSTSISSNSFTVSMDFDSFQYICMNKFTLLAGIDELTFEIII